MSPLHFDCQLVSAWPTRSGLPDREEAMRLAAFEHAGTARLGLVEGDSIIDLAEAAPDLPRDLTGVIRAGAFAAAAQAARTARPGARHKLAGLRFLPRSEEH